MVLGLRVFWSICLGLTTGLPCGLAFSCDSCSELSVFLLAGERRPYTQ